MTSFDTQDLAVRHMARSHHPDVIYSDLKTQEIRLNQIDSSLTPTLKYKELMNGVCRDQLKDSLKESTFRKDYLSQQKYQSRTEYNRMCDNNNLLELNQVEKRRQYYNAIQDQQTRRGESFIDAQRLKGNKIEDHIKVNEGSHLFYRLQDQYDTYKKNFQNSYRNGIALQVTEKESINRVRREEKENQLNNRKRIEDYVHKMQDHEKMEQTCNKMQYKEELDRLVEAKSPKRDITPQIQPHQRHNPITNPIDHHVQNPYLMRRIMDRLNS